MASLKPLFARLSASWPWLPYAAGVGLFLWLCAQFYLPGQGFTALALFSEKQSAHYLPELRDLNFYAEKDTYGYDAQYYAQIAMHPRLGDPELKEAVDSLPYRARRILFCWTAYVIGGGNPAWALHVYTVQNIVAWLLLAWVLLRWFPPTGLQNILRWFAVMFTFGLTFSVRDSLVDGPSLLLIAIAMALGETQRPGWSAVLLGIAGLGKETNILGGAALLPARWRDAREWRRCLWRGLIVVAPLLAWLLYLKVKLGTGGDVGARNFDWPFVGYLHKWREIVQPLLHHGSGVVGRTGVYVMLAMTAQWLFFALRPRWKDAWWRLGASYSALLVFLGDAVWEGFPGAAPRVLLPMTLAFNVLLPRGRRWWALLIVGNLLVLRSFETMIPPGRESFEIRGPHSLRVEEPTGEEVAAQFDDADWFTLERSYVDYWRWARGPAVIRLHNPHAYALDVDVKFRLKSSDTRNVTVRLGDQVLWTGPTEQTMPDLVFRHVRLAAGETRLQFESDRPAAIPPNGDIRKVAYRVCNFTITINGRSQ